LNGALAASDLSLAGDAAKVIGKGGIHAIKGFVGEKVAKDPWPSVRG
jgi:hypothetical protein